MLGEEKEFRYDRDECDKRILLHMPESASVTAFSVISPKQ